MGNQLPTKSGSTDDATGNADDDSLTPKSVSQIVDYIATYYILTQDFAALKKLYDKEYCDRLVILTADLLDRSFTGLDISYLAARVKQGDLEGEAGAGAEEEGPMINEHVLFTSRDRWDKGGVRDPVKKKRMCVAISKFYVKIAHLFAAIVTTINPVYVYRDAAGNKVRATLAEKASIPVGTPRELLKLGICNTRIRALEKGMPTPCDLAVNARGDTKTLDEEPGIPELEQLYYDDAFDFEKGEFTGMSPENRRQYESDLRIFYTAFTGQASMPPNVTRFADIRLRNYGRDGGAGAGGLCSASAAAAARGVKKQFKENAPGGATAAATDPLFRNYADHLRKMVYNANKNQEALLEVINRIFVYVVDPRTHTRHIRIHPDLTEKSLQDVVKRTRALIIRLYLTCEMDYVDGLKLYEAVVEKKILETSQRQIERLESLSDEMFASNAEQAQVRREVEQEVRETAPVPAPAPPVPAAPPRVV